MYDLLIVGSGPAGYVAAIRAGQLGLKTAIIESESIGGSCLNWGCIPSKAILESVKLYQKIKKDATKFGIDGIDQKELSFNWNRAIARSNTIVRRLTAGVDYLLKKNGVEVVKGSAKILSPTSLLVENRVLEGKNIILATGSYSKEIISPVEGLVIGAKELFTKREIPQNIVIVGRNPVAVEFAQALTLIGRDVTLIANAPSIMERADVAISSYMTQQLQKEGVRLIFNSEVTDITNLWSNGKLTIEGNSIAADLIINANDRIANFIESDIEIERENNFIKSDSNFESSVKGIFAIGDLNGKGLFAHFASAQALHVVNYLNGVEGELDLEKIPMNIYTLPEAAQIGVTEKIAKERGYDYKVSQFPLSANGKAQTEGNTEGFIRIISEKRYGEVLGIQIIAPNATDMINEAAAYMQLESTIYDIANTIHTHPTVSEIFMEAGFEAVDRAIHM
ncbi:MAG: dihydrolipoyl dehydrogenase [Bacteroidales bacterium]